MLLAFAVVGAPLLILVGGGWADALAGVFLSPRLPFAVRVPTVTPNAQQLASLGLATPTLQHIPAMPIEEMGPANFWERLIGVESIFGRARRSLEQEDYGAAVVDLDEVLRHVPEHAYAHYLRAEAYMHLATMQRTQEEYLRNVEATLADLEQVIALQPLASGNVHYLRFLALDRLAGMQATRLDREYLDTLALESLRLAVHMGASEPFAKREPVLYLTYLGRCNEAMDETRALAVGVPPEDRSQAGIHNLYSAAYRCAGDFETALTHMDRAIQINGIPSRLFAKAILLYSLGRLEEALAVLTDIIDDDPYYDGYRYYFRALVYEDLGQPDLADADMQIGSMNSWPGSAIEAYILGRRALAAGDTDSGIALLQDAEVSMERTYAGLLERIQFELASIGAALLEPALSVTYAPTPFPTPLPTPTPHADSADPSLPEWTVHRFAIEEGTGPVAIHPGQNVFFHLQPSQPLETEATLETLTVWLLLMDPGPYTISAEGPWLYLWNRETEMWNPFLGFLAYSEVEDPQPYVYPEGDMFLVAEGRDPDISYVHKIGVMLTYRRPDGSTLTVGAAYPYAP